MNSTPNNSANNFRIYIFEQTKSIDRLHKILSSNIFSGVLKRGISIIFEIVLFLFFLGFLIVAIYLPLDPIKVTEVLTDDTTIKATVHNDSITTFMIIIKSLLFIISLMPLMIMMLLRRNRKKGALINEAFAIVKDMKLKHNVASQQL